MEGKSISLEEKLARLVKAGVDHILQDKIRPQVHLAEKRQVYVVEVLEHMHQLIVDGKDSMESRPPNYRFIADLVQSTAYKNLIMDFGTPNMSNSQRAKDVKPFLANLMLNNKGWYRELCTAAERKGFPLKGCLTHYVNCHPSGQSADKQEGGNKRRQRLVQALLLTVKKLAEKYPTAVYSENVDLELEVKAVSSSESESERDAGNNSPQPSPPSRWNEDQYPIRNGIPAKGIFPFVNNDTGEVVEPEFLADIDLGDAAEGFTFLG